jgi:hypothetical protein
MYFTPGLLLVCCGRGAAQHDDDRTPAKSTGSRGR